MRRDPLLRWKKPHPLRYIHAKLGLIPRSIRRDMHENPFLAKYSSTRNYVHTNEARPPLPSAQVPTLRHTHTKFGLDPCNIGREIARTKVCDAAAEASETCQIHIAPTFHVGANNVTE